MYVYTTNICTFIEVYLYVRSWKKEGQPVLPQSKVSCDQPVGPTGQKALISDDIMHGARIIVHGPAT